MTRRASRRGRRRRWAPSGRSGGRPRTPSARSPRSGCASPVRGRSPVRCLARDLDGVATAPEEEGEDEVEDDDGDDAGADGAADGDADAGRSALGAEAVLAVE